MSDGTEDGNLTNSTFPPYYTLPQVLLLTSTMTLLSFVTVVGNLLVILAFYLDRNIRIPSNYFILSLGVSDLLIGLEGFPIFTVYVVQKQWTMGWFICDLWLSIDYVVCLASIYTVLMITIDRFCSVRIATLYRNWRTQRKVEGIIVVVWAIPTVLFFVTIFGWSSFVGERTIPPNQCYVQFMMDPYFNMSMYIAYYWSTLVVMLVLYGGIYKAAMDLQKKSVAKQKRLADAQAMRISMKTKQAEEEAEAAAARSPLSQKQSNCQSYQQRLSTETSDENSSLVIAQQQRARRISTEKHSMFERSRKISIGNLAAVVKVTQKWRTLPKSKMRESASTFAADEHIQVVPHVKRISLIPANQVCHSNFDYNNIIPEVDSDKSDPVSDRSTSIATLRVPGTLDNLTTTINRSSSTNMCAGPHFNYPFLCNGAGGIDSPQTSGEDRKSEETEELSSGAGVSDAETQQSHVSKTSIASVAFDPFLYFPPEQLLDFRYIDQDSAASSIKSKCSINPALTDLNISCQHVLNKSLISPMRFGGKVSDVENPKIEIDEADETTSSTQGHPKPESTASFDGTDATQHTAPELSSTVVQSLGYQSRESQQLLMENQIGARTRKISQGMRKPSFKRYTMNMLRYSRKASASKRGENRARKALRTITIILGAFIFFWTPFYVVATVYGFCPRCVPVWLYEASYYLCYMNSPINPLCYALANAQFKKAFTRILKGNFHRIN